jgi:sporulation protein YlmC with PRC-barrel domain
VLGREMDLGLDLLDRQIVDKDGQPAGNVDDVEFEWPRGGSGPPYVSAILAGPAAWSKRLDGRLGRAVGTLHARLSERDAELVRISMAIVKRVGVMVELTVAASDLGTWNLQRWAREKIVLKIPGAGHAPE